MSKNIDERVVEMKFDNAEFEKGIKESSASLEQFNKSLQLEGATKGLQEVSNSAQNNKVHYLGDAVEEVQKKFSALEMVALGFFQSLGRDAYNYGKQLVSSLTIDPISQGFSEYELKMNSVQTIMASTGEKIDVVNGYLEELNKYSDKTIYSFSDMTQNIGKFTNAGVKLEDAVAAIKGISNEAAVSGANANEASRAMYNFSQALSAGYVKLIDWKSIENANMATKEFKQQLIDTAVALGTVVKEGDKYISTTTNADGKVSDAFDSVTAFNDSLNHQWMTTEVLTQTLANYSTDVREMTAAELENYKARLKNIGYTDEQIDGIVELSKKAYDSATEVKTFTQLIETLQEAVGSGWAQTFEIIFGDLEEAKELWTGINNVIGAFIDKQSDARNEMLKVWDSLGGREELFDGFVNIFEGMKSVIAPIAEAFRDIFPPMTGERLAAITKGFAELTSHLRLNDTAMENLKNAFRGFFAVFNIIFQIIKSAVTVFLPPIAKMLSAIGAAVLEVTGSIGNGVAAFNSFLESTNAITIVLTTLRDILGSAFDFIAWGIGGIVAKIAEFSQSHFGTPDMSGLNTVADKVREVLGSLSGVTERVRAFFNGLKEIIVAAMPVIKKALNGIVSALSSFKKQAVDKLNTISSKDVFDTGTGIGIAGIGVGLFGFFKALSKFIKDLKPVVKEVTNVLTAVKGVLVQYQNEIKSKVLRNIAISVGILAASIYLLGQLDYGKIALATFAVGSMAKVLVKTLNELNEAFSGDNAMSMGQISKMSIGMIALSIALNQMAKAIKQLQGLNPLELSLGLVAVVTMLEAMVQAMTELNEADIKNSGIKIGIGMIAIATSLLIMSKAVKSFGSLDPGVLIQGLFGIALALGELAAFFRLIGNPAHAIAIGIGIGFLAGSLILFKKAVQSYQNMKLEDLAKGLVKVGMALVELGVFMRYAGNAKHSIAVAIAIGILSGTLMLFKKAVESYASMNFGTLIYGLIGIAGSLIILGTALAGLSNSKHVIGSAAAILILVAAMNLLVPAIAGIAAVGLGGVVTALLAMAGAMFIFVSAARLVTPGIAKGMLVLAGALALLGVAVLAVGAGLLALASALAIISVVGVGAIGILSQLVVAIVTSFIDALADSVPTIAEVLLETILNSLKLLVAYGPQIVEYLFTFLIQVIDGLIKYVPILIQKIGELFTVIFEEGAKAFASIDPVQFAETLGLVALVAGVMTAMWGVSHIAGGAMVGLAEAGAFIAELGALLTAFGALQQIPGLQWIISEGGTLLSEIAAQIGKIAGSFISGGLEGLTSKLPAVGTNLSDFMTNIGGFLKGAARIKPEKLEGLKSLAGALLALTAAELIDQITSFIGGGGDSIKKFTESVGPLGDGLKTFTEKVKDISDEDVESAGRAAKVVSTLAAAASEIPNSGGLLGMIVGDNDADDFGNQLVGLADGLVDFSKKTKDLDTESVEKATTAANMLSAMAADIPNSGGLLGMIVGNNDIDDFGEKLPTLGEGLRDFAIVVKGLVVSDVEKASYAGSMLSDLAAKIPHSEGFIENIIGNNDIDDFGEKLPILGLGLSGFALAVQGIDDDKVTSSAKAAEALVTLSQKLPLVVGGITALASGVETQSLSDFGDELSEFGTYLKAYNDAIVGVDAEQLSKMNIPLSELVTFSSNITNSGLSYDSIVDFADGLAYLGEYGIKKLIESLNGMTLDSDIADTISKFKTIFNRITKIIDTNRPMLDTQMNETGVGLISNLVKGVTSKLEWSVLLIQASCAKIVKAIKDTLNEKNIKPIGVDAIKYLANGLNDAGAQKSASDAATKLGNTVIAAFKKVLSTTNLKSVGEAAALGIAEGIKAKIKEIADAAIEAAKKAVEAAKQAFGESSPSAKMYSVGAYASIDMANGIADYANEIEAAGEELGETAIDTMRKALDKIADVLDSDLDSEPVISPVVDLTNIQNGVKDINSMLNGQLDLAAAINRVSISIPKQDRLYVNGLYSDKTEPVQNNYQFTQNNYSPKALSRLEIYRQTRNQFAAMRGAMSGI